MYSPVYQDDGSDPAAGGSAVTAAAAAPRDDDGGDDDDTDGGGGSRRKQSREGPARAPAADDDEGDAISSPGHRPVLRLSARAPSRRCSRSHPLQNESHRLVSNVFSIDASLMNSRKSSRSLVKHEGGETSSSGFYARKFREHLY